MAARSHPLPEQKDLLTLAPRHESLASLARAIGWKPNSFRVRLQSEGWTEVEEALQPGGAKQDAIDGALKEVARLVP